jgi:hypothetical protein
MKTVKWRLVLALFIILLANGKNVRAAEEGPTSFTQSIDQQEYPGIPRSSLYEVAVTEEGQASRPLVVFQSSCPKYQPGYMGLRPVDQYPFKLFEGRSVSWVNFSFSKAVTVRVRVLEPGKILSADSVKILPSRLGLTPLVSGNTISFTMTEPGQCSVEIGDKGYQHGLVIFANPPETDKPDPAAGNYYIVNQATPAEIKAVPASYSGIYFKSGVHDMGVYHVPDHIKNIYFADGSWVYGALIIDKHPLVKIFGRGVLSEAKLNYRESHLVEAINHSDQIDLEGIVLADTKFFAVRLLGTNNTVKWIKIIGGWTYNTDGIAAFAGSTVAHCFIWANDDSIKPYADNLKISDCVVWQLNNGAVIQLGWGNDKATHVTISRVDVLHAEWNNDAANRGVVSCIGDKFARGGMSSWQRSFLIEDLVTETPVPFIFNLRPNPASSDQMRDITFKNWNVQMNMRQGWSNRIEGGSATNPFSGFVFDGVVLNNVKLTESNWTQVGHFEIKNVATPAFR